MDQSVVPSVARLIVAELLVFIATYCAYLFDQLGYRIVNSQATGGSGNALLVLESKQLRLQFTRDRGQFLMEFQPISGSRQEWFSQGLLKGMLQGHRGGSEVLTPDWAGFLKGALPELERLLADPERHEATVAALRQQARLRAKELFG